MANGAPWMPQVGGQRQQWVPVNPCDHEIHTPYYIGQLVIAAANCTEACPTTTYPDNAQVCHPCSVVGCATCSRAGCEDCLIFHLGTDGQCVFLFGAIFAAVMLFVICFFLCGLLRFCCYGVMSAKNPDVLKEGLFHRRRAKVHDYSLPGNPFYAYDDTNVRSLPISGVGPVLYFRFIAVVVLLSFMLVVGVTVGFFLPRMVSQKNRPLAALVHAVSCYALFLGIVIRWTWTQNKVAKADVEEEPHLRSYALVAEGFPKNARSPHEIKAFFEAILGFEVEGVSVAYDHVEELEFIEDRTTRAIEKADCHLGVYPTELSGLESHVGDSQDGYVLDCLMNSGYAFVVFSREEDREFCMRRFADIQRQCQQLMITAQEEDDEDPESAILQNGIAKGRKPGASSAIGPSRAVLFRGKFPIRVGNAPEPCGILWSNFAVRQGAKVVRVAVTLLMLLLLVMVFGSVMFAPAILYEMSYVDIRKPTSVQWQNSVLEQALVSASIAIGNRLLMWVLKYSVEQAGFLQKVNEDAVLVACAFTTIVLNSTSALIIASIVAGSERILVTPQLAVSSMFQVLWMCIVTTELLRIMGPAWTFWTAYFRVRQSRYISVRESEPYLMTPRFELATKYADVLHLVTLLCLMVALKSDSLYTVGAQYLMLVYTIYLYFMDKYFFLRFNRQTYYKSPKLDSTVHYLFALPVSIIFASPLSHIFIEKYKYANVLIFFGNTIACIIMTRLCQRCNEAQRELTGIPYVEVASLAPYNYFNSNHVHVLRTLHFPSIVVPPIYPYAPGKEYLQGGQFADYDDSVRLRETLMLLVKSPLKGIDDFGNPQDLG